MRAAVDVVSVQVDSVKEMDDIIQGLQQQVAFTQDNISDCQMSIMQMEKNKVRWKVRQMGFFEESNRCKICWDALTLQKDT